jgi:hypothetical protein
LLEASKQPCCYTPTNDCRDDALNKNGSWIENDDAPTSFITPVSRRRLKAAIRKVFEINSAAVRTEARPTAIAPFRKTPSKLEELLEDRPLILHNINARASSKC